MVGTPLNVPGLSRTLPMLIGVPLKDLCFLRVNLMAMNSHVLGLHVLQVFRAPQVSMKGKICLSNLHFITGL